MFYDNPKERKLIIVERLSIKNQQKYNNKKALYPVRHIIDKVINNQPITKEEHSKFLVQLEYRFRIKLSNQGQVRSTHVQQAIYVIDTIKVI